MSTRAGEIAMITLFSSSGAAFAAWAKHYCLDKKIEANSD
jgi:hypothetical protein